MNIRNLALWAVIVVSLVIVAKNRLFGDGASIKLDILLAGLAAAALGGVLTAKPKTVTGCPICPHRLVSRPNPPCKDPCHGQAQKNPTPQGADAQRLP